MSKPLYSPAAIVACLAGLALCCALDARGQGLTNINTRFHMDTRPLEEALAQVEPGDPDYERLSTELAEVYQNQGRYQDAARLLRDVLDQRTAMDERTINLVLLMAENCRWQRDYANAIGLLEPLLEQLASDIDPWLDFEINGKLAELYLLSGNVPAARERYLRLLRDHPERHDQLDLPRLVDLYTLGGLQAQELDAVLQGADAGDLTPSLIDSLLRGYAERRDKGRFVAWIERLSQLQPRNLLASVKSAQSAATRLGIDAEVDKALSTAAMQPNAADESVLAYARYLELKGNHTGALGVARTREGEAFLALQADVLLSGRRYEQAIPVLEQLTQTAPNAPDRWRDLGVAYAETGEEEQAVTSWMQIPRVSRGNVTGAWLDVRNLCQRYGLVEAAREADRQLVQVQSSWRTAPTRLAASFLEQERYDAALEVYLDTARGLGEPDPNLRMNWLFTIRRLHAEAAVEKVVSAALEDGVRDDKEREWLLSLWIELLLRLERYEDSVDVALRFDPPVRGEMLLQIGQTLARAGMDQAAIDALRQVQDEDANGAHAAAELLTLEMESGNREAARGAGRRALSLLPAHSPLRQDTAYRLAEVEVALHDPGAALEILNNLPVPADGDLEWPVFHTLRGEAQLLLGAVRAASGELWMVVEQSRQPAWRNRAAMRMADVMLWEGEIEAAEAAYREVIQVDIAGPHAMQALERRFMLALMPETILPYYVRATQFAFQGRHDDAIREYRELAVQLREYPDGAARAMLALARLEADRGNLQTAHGECQRALELAKDDRLEAEIRWMMLALEPPVSATHEQVLLENFIVDYPDTIFADRARRKLP